MRRRFALLALMLVVPAAAVVGTAVPAAYASTQGCSNFANIGGRTYGKYLSVSTTDTSVYMQFQGQKCTFGTAIDWRFRVRVTNVRASGKSDLAVAIKWFGSTTGKLGSWHPSVRAGTTWTSPALSAPRGRYVDADIHTYYRHGLGVPYAKNFYGMSAPFRI